MALGVYVGTEIGTKICVDLTHSTIIFLQYILYIKLPFQTILEEYFSKKLWFEKLTVWAGLFICLIAFWFLY